MLTDAGLDCVFSAGEKLALFSTWKKVEQKTRSLAHSLFLVFLSFP